MRKFIVFAALAVSFAIACNMAQAEPAAEEENNNRSSFARARFVTPFIPTIAIATPVAFVQPTVGFVGVPVTSGCQQSFAFQQQQYLPQQSSCLPQQQVVQQSPAYPQQMFNQQQFLPQQQMFNGGYGGSSVGFNGGFAGGYGGSLGGGFGVGFGTGIGGFGGLGNFGIGLGVDQLLGLGFSRFAFGGQNLIIDRFGREVIFRNGRAFGFGRRFPVNAFGRPTAVARGNAFAVGNGRQNLIQRNLVAPKAAARIAPKAAPKAAPAIRRK